MFRGANFAFTFAGIFLISARCCSYPTSGTVRIRALRFLLEPKSSHIRNTVLAIEFDGHDHIPLATTESQGTKNETPSLLTQVPLRFRLAISGS